MSPLRILLPRSEPTSRSLNSQWTNPGDILSLLLLIGGDVVRCALAQQVGDVFPTPVVFSFGWVAYALVAVLSAVSRGQLSPDSPDCPAVVFSTERGHLRSNRSWILGRIVRDFESYWIPDEVKEKLEIMLERAGKPKAGLCISVFEALPPSAAVAGIPRRDLYWYSGYAVALVQLGISAIPWGLWGEWEIFAVTGCGTLLAFTTASLPRWRAERWNCRRNSRKTFVLTRGNGAQHAIVVQGKGRGLDLEDLATPVEAFESLGPTRFITMSLTVLWVALLITVSGIKEQTWFLVAVGTIGMIHTIVVAGAPRKPEWFGVHLRFCEVYAETTVMTTLKAAEKSIPGLGKAMLQTFFPGGLRPADESWWNDLNMRGHELEPRAKPNPNAEIRDRSQLDIHRSSR